MRLPILVGGALQQFAWAILGFCLIFVWSNGGSSLLRSLVYFSGDLAAASAEVVEVTGTGISVNGREYNTFRYRFPVGDEMRSGSTDALEGTFAVGDRAPIEYAVKDPSHTRFREGLGLPPWRWRAFVFGALAAGLVAFSVRRAHRRNALLASGVMIFARRVSTLRAHGTNASAWWVHTYELTVERGRRLRISCRSGWREHFADSGGVVYSGVDPSCAFVLEGLPGRPFLTRDGELRGRWLSALPWLLIPGGTALAHGLHFLRVLEVF